MKFFSLDTPIMQKVTKYASIVLMNIWWLLCCIPVFTIGASTAAMYTVLFQIREEGAAAAADFFAAFKENFKKATLIWLSLLGTLLVLVLCYVGVLFVANDSVRLCLATVAAALLILWFMAGMLVFPLTAYFENTVKNTMKNAVLVTLRYIRKTIPCCALTILPVLLAILSPYWFLRLLFLWGCVFAGLIAYWKTAAYQKIFEDLSGDAGQDLPEN